MGQRTVENEINISYLKREVEATFGRTISNSRDCILLSEDIFVRTSHKISRNTLRRFYGLVKSSFLPSNSTLYILSRYCGFESLDELLTSFQCKKDSEKLKSAQSEAILNYLVSFFKYTPTRAYVDETFMVIVKHTILFLQQYPQITDDFQRAIAKTKNGQDVYFEQFVNIDALNSFYGDGLRYYLNEKRDPEAQIFGNSLLCLRAWLTDDFAEVTKYYQQVTRYTLNKTIHPFVCGRYFATQLYYGEMAGIDVERVMIDAQKCHASLIPGNENYRHFPAFEYVFSFALMITGHYEEALYYINYGINNYTEKHSSLDSGFYQSFQLIRAITLVKTGNKTEAEKVYKTIVPSQFYVISKKANTMGYLLLGKYLNKTNTAFEQQFQSLVEATGFTRLFSIYQAILTKK